MDIRIVAILVWEGKAFVPTQARYHNNGPFTGVAPIYEVKPEPIELLLVVQSILSKKPAVLATPTKDEIKERNDLLPKKTKALSWKRIYQTGIYYIIELSEKGYVLEMSQSQNKGHWEMDPAKRLLFNRQTDLSVIIQAILNDIEKRSK
jgi:hypothetical protein